MFKRIMKAINRHFYNKDVSWITSEFEKLQRDCADKK
jgi:hypothetical protein